MKWVCGRQWCKQRSFHFIISVITFSDSRAPLTQPCVGETGADMGELWAPTLPMMRWTPPCCRVWEGAYFQRRLPRIQDLTDSFRRKTLEVPCVMKDIPEVPLLTLLQQPEVCLHVTVRHFPPCSPAGRSSDNQCNLLADVQLEVSFHQSNVLGSTREAGKGCLRDLLQVNVPPCCCWAQDTCLPPCVVSPTCWVWNLELWKVYLRTRHSVAKLFSPDLQNSWYVLKIP